MNKLQLEKIGTKNITKQLTYTEYIFTAWLIFNK